ncbi:MAG: alpha/beta hydrolase [Aggregatilineales bacterium]
MNTVTSKDGTTIAYDKAGQGAPLILVGGAFEQRAMDSETAQLAAFPLLAENFTVIHYDRRGRGDSANTLPFAVAREIEDIEALIDATGGSAYVFGISSGAALAFEAALSLGNKVKKLALYEPPYNDDADARQAWRTFRTELDAVLADGRNADAVGLFMGLMGVPPEHLAGMREMPMWGMWEGVAPTIAYDAAALGEEAAIPIANSKKLTMSVLVMNGGESFPFMQTTAEALADAIPDAEHRVVTGQAHEVSADALAPILVDFFSA